MSRSQRREPAFTGDAEPANASSFFNHRLSRLFASQRRPEGGGVSPGGGSLAGDPTAMRPAAPELLADRAYAELRDRIVTLAIPPGAPINEDALGRELEMGRTPVREAIKRLALENLVTVFPRRGTFASEINITDLAHISGGRQQLEGHAASRASQRLTAARREELEALLVRIDESAGGGREEQ